MHTNPSLVSREDTQPSGLGRGLTCRENSLGGGERHPQLDVQQELFHYLCKSAAKVQVTVSGETAP